MTIPSHAELLREYLEQLSQPGGESRLPAWKDWVRLRGVGGAMAIGAALALVGCDDSDTGTGNGNIAGGAGMQSTTGSGGMNVTALYAAPMTGGTGATTDAGGSSAGGAGAATAAGGTSTVALYGAPMEKRIPPLGSAGE